MSSVSITQELRGGRRLRDRFGDRLLLIVTCGAGLGAVALIGFIAYKVVHGAHLALSTFGLSFVWHTAWDTNRNVFGAAPGLYGTAVTSAIALIIATPLALAVALFLSELAPRGLRVVVGSLVETLAAIPSVVLGLWGILVLGPFLADHVEPWLHSWFGFIPIFGGSPSSSGIFVAGLILGLGRALGEAIAVAQVIGAGWFIRSHLFATGDTLAARIALQYQGAVSKLQIASLFYLAAILLVIGLLTNLLAQVVVRRFAYQRTGGS